LVDAILARHVFGFGSRVIEAFGTVISIACVAVVEGRSTGVIDYRSVERSNPTKSMPLALMPAGLAVARALVMLCWLYCQVSEVQTPRTGNGRHPLQSTDSRCIERCLRLCLLQS
jgi:hypothetical protein